MTISRRDTILIAVLINIGLLSILFMTAVQTEDEPIADSREIQHVANIEIPFETPLSERSSNSIAIQSETSHDEVDKAIHEFQAKSQSFESPIPKETAPITETVSKYVEITVKRGDALEKIAKANGTTVKEIRKINHLNSDALSIGQKLQLPAQKEDLSETPAVSSFEDDGVHYVIKAGDNPWKIARKFHVKYDEILKLNNLDEDKARNLKVGETIRVK